MREILFKAKRESNRKWVEGYYYKESLEKDGVIVYKPKADVSVRIDIKNK